MNLAQSTTFSESFSMPRSDSPVDRSASVEKEETADIRSVPQSERSPIQLYLQEIGKTPLLKPDEEVALARRIQRGDTAARNHMIQANLLLVVKIAGDYNNFGLPLMDLISEGNIGLVKAVERFDPDKGGKLSTYAAWWIKQSIKRALANQGKTIRLPVHLVDKIAKMRKITTALAEELEREPTDEEIAYQMGLPTHKIAHLRSVSVRPASLDAPVGNEEDTKFGELVGDEKATTPFQDLHTKSLSSDVADVLHRLDEREAQIIRMRFGLDSDKAMTLEEVGQEFNITRERVRQLQEIAIQKMRRAMSGRDRQRTREEIHEETLERKKLEVLNEFFKKQRG